MFLAQNIVAFWFSGGAKGAKCLKLEKQNSLPSNGGGCNKARNMFLQVGKLLVELAQVLSTYVSLI